MNTTTQLSRIGEQELFSINGGGFAYDLARVIRFIVLSGGGANTINAVIDWEATEVANEIVNG